MPDYEYFCRRCQKPFAMHLSIREHEEKLAECPRCKSEQEVEKQISQFNVQTTRKSTAPG